MLEVKANALEESFDAILQADRIAGLEERDRHARRGAADAGGAGKPPTAAMAPRDRTPIRCARPLPSDICGAALRRSRAQELLGCDAGRRWLCRAARDRPDDRGGAQGDFADPCGRQCRAHRDGRLSQAGDDRWCGLGLGLRNGIARRDRYADLPGNRATFWRALCQPGRQPGDAGRCAVRCRKLARRRDRLASLRARRVRRSSAATARTSPRGFLHLRDDQRGRQCARASARFNMSLRARRAALRRPIRRTSSSISFRH